jgi:hypothetical protein
MTAAVVGAIPGTASAEKAGGRQAEVHARALKVAVVGQVLVREPLVVTENHASLRLASDRRGIVSLERAKCARVRR